MIIVNTSDEYFIADFFSRFFVRRWEAFKEVFQCGTTAAPLSRRLSLLLLNEPNDNYGPFADLVIFQLRLLHHPLPRRHSVQPESPLPSVYCDQFPELINRL